MALIRIAGFSGEVQTFHPSLLAEHQGTLSRNQRPGRGDLRSWNEPQTVANVPIGRQSMYRMGRDVASDSTYWLSWATVVHAVRGFDTGDTSERTYYSGDGVPKVTDNVMGLGMATSTTSSSSSTSPTSNYPTASRPLGLPAPTAALSVSTLAGGTGELTSSYYVYTYVNDWGWESAPSTVSAENTRPSDAQATLSGFALPPAGNYQINRMRIYRTATGSSGATDFFFLREIAIGTQSTTDDARDLGEVCPTVARAMPPENLTHLSALWNGMLAGISGNRIRFCEPYVAYVWPESYDVIPPDSKPVALGVFGQQLVVLTNGRPLVVSGSSPDSLDQQLIDLPQACIAPRSVVSMGSGVAWASEDGLCWLGSGGARLLTAGVLTRADWQALKPSSIMGAYYEGLYLGSFDDGAGRRGYLIDPASSTGMYFFDLAFSALYVDPIQDQLYGLSGVYVQRFDGSQTPLTYRFRSKVFRAPQPINFSCLEVQADAYPVTIKVDALDLPSATVNALIQRLGSRLSAPTPTSLRYTVAVPGPEAQRLPAGFMAQHWQVELEGTAPVQSLALASSVEELAQV